MRIFEQGEKINFVDENNVLLGYDIGQSCCEYANWFIADKPQDTIPEPLNQESELQNYTFDTGYFTEAGNENVLDAGSIAIFRITDGTNEKFIHLFNCHNGYYYHGFDFIINKTTLHSGRI